VEGDIRDGNLTLKEIRDDWGSIGATRGLPPKVSPMDADGLVELNGHMLLFERDRYGNITDGQRRVLREFSAKPDCEAWYVPGPKNTFPKVTVYRGGTVDAEYDWSDQPEPIQVEAITLLLADFTRRAGRKPRDGRLP
jgi:hypothetical protein